MVDAIAGGGGLLTLPALFVAGLEPSAALATNKGQSVFGSTASTFEYARRGTLDRGRAPYSFAAAALGAVMGARLVLAVSPSVLRPVVVVLLPLAAVVSLVKRPAPPVVRFAGPAARLPAFAIAFVLGFYDGFFGPGTGTFLLFAYVLVFGDTLVAASGNAKVANMASNLSSLALFAFGGAVRWPIALPMGVAQLAGALVGTSLAVRRGAGVVRAVAVVVSVGVVARVAWQWWVSRS